MHYICDWKWCDYVVQVKCINIVNQMVVICFHFSIFDISNTPTVALSTTRSSCDLLLNLYLWNIKYTRSIRSWNLMKLWFAFKFVSLKYQIHPLCLFLFFPLVVICFWICIFEISNTPKFGRNNIFYSCDLLLNLYLWNIKYT